MNPKEIHLGVSGTNPFPSVCGTHEVEMLLAEYVRICQRRDDWRPVVITEFDKGNASYMDEAIFGQWFEWERERESVVLGVRGCKLMVAAAQRVCKKCHWPREDHNALVTIDIAPAPCREFR